MGVLRGVVLRCLPFYNNNQYDRTSIKYQLLSVQLLRSHTRVFETMFDTSCYICRKATTLTRINRQSQQRSSNCMVFLLFNKDQQKKQSSKPVPKLDFSGSAKYWEERYRADGDSGAGSYGRLAEFKARTLNEFVDKHKVKSVVEWGCGDGAQLALAKYPQYLGMDVAKGAIALCQTKFKNDATKSFIWYDSEHFHDPARFIAADMSMSLDVIFHLIEDEVFEGYMQQLFSSAKKYVVVYSSNYADPGTKAVHVKHRHFTKWVDKHAKQWTLLKKIDNDYPFDASDPSNTSFADFYFFKRS